MVITSINVKREDVFTTMSSPACRVAELRPVCNVLEDWHGSATLSSTFRVTKLGWPVEVSLRPGVEPEATDGMEPWRAERALNGLLHREPYFVETATWLLSESSGILLNLPGNARGLVVAESHFDSSVEVGEPIYFSELGEAIPADPRYLANMRGH